jgi:hypothetical protein
VIKYAAAMGANVTVRTDRLYLHEDDQATWWKSVPGEALVV